MIKKLTQHLKHLLSPKKTCKLLGGVEGKYKWLRFEGEKQNGNKMFSDCEFCRELIYEKEKLAILPRIGSNNFQTDSLKAHTCIMGPVKDMLSPMFKNMEFLFLTLHITCILYV